MSYRKITHSGNVLLAGFGAMLLMMSVLIFLVVKQDIPMVSRNYYEQELVYQQKLDAIAQTADFERAFHISGNGTMVQLQLPPALSAQISKGQVYFYCPSSERADRKENLDANPGGLYTFERAQLPGAAYIVKVSFTAGGRDYYKELAFRP